jgi:hypothetical protein
MSFQKCPHCNGTGVEPSNVSFDQTSTCTVCKGSKIISQLTGLPPNRGIDKSNSSDLIDIQKIDENDIGV